MMYKSSWIAIAAVVLELGVGSSAQALTLATAALTPDPGGYVYCKVVVTSTTPIGITARIIDDSGTNVTEFGSSWRVSPSATADGRFYAEETAGSFSPGIRPPWLTPFFDSAEIAA